MANTYGAILSRNQGKDKKTGLTKREMFPVSTTAGSKAEAIREFEKVQRESKTKSTTKTFSPAGVRKIENTKKFFSESDSRIKKLLKNN